MLLDFGCHYSKIVVKLSQCYPNLIPNLWQNLSKIVLVGCSLHIDWVWVMVGDAKTVVYSSLVQETYIKVFEKFENVHLIDQRTKRLTNE